MGWSRDFLHTDQLIGKAGCIFKSGEFRFLVLRSSNKLAGVNDHDHPQMVAVIDTNSYGNAGDVMHCSFLPPTITWITFLDTITEMHNQQRESK